METTQGKQVARRPPIQEQPVTIYDVAHRVGVSTATVSRVLAGFVNYRPETRVRVLEAVRELGYVPNIQAQGLALGKSRQRGEMIQPVDCAALGVETESFG